MSAIMAGSAFSSISEDAFSFSLSFLNSSWDTALTISANSDFFTISPPFRFNYSTVRGTLKGVDTMTRNMQKKLADAQEFAKKLDKLDRTQLI